MVKRILELVTFMILAVAAVARADCSSTTPNIGLKPCTMGTAWSAVGPAWIANWSLLDFDFTAPLTRTGVTVSLGTVPEAKGGTGQTTYAVGDTLKVATADTITKLAGNVTTTRKFRRQKGNGTAVTEDDWGALVASDLPSPTITSLSQLDASLCSGNQYIRNSAGTSWVCDSALLVTLSQISDSLCTAGKSVRRKASGAGWECYSAGGGGGTVFSGGSGGTNVSNSVTSYFPVSGIGYSTTSASVATYVYPAGVWSAFGCNATDTNTTGNGHTLTLDNCGSSALTCSTTTSLSCDAGATTETVGSGCMVKVKAEILGTPTVNRSISCSATFTPS